MTDNTDPTDARAFFLDTGSDQLRAIFWWARARYAAPWAVLGAILLRVAASIPAHVQLPGLIGGRASLNLLCAFVSASGGGKGISDKVARLAWPTMLLELPIGSGEGIAETFANRTGKEDENTVTAAIFNVPEIDTLAGIASRQGSILLAQLKSMAMGEQLGQSNASRATSRIVAAHSYRACMSVGAQPGHCDVLFADTSGGTPQRFLWFPTVDPSMPADRAPDADPLDTRLPSMPPVDGVFEIGYGPAEIAETVISAHIARQRGQADSLDGHALLTRCKVAAVLAVMHGRTVVSEWDWARSAEVMAVSDSTRQWLLDEAKKAQRAKVRERALSRATFDEMIDQRHGATVRNRILTLLANGPMPRGELRRAMGKQHYREAFDEVLPHLEKVSQIITVPGEKAAHYKLNPEFTGEPEFTPEKASSDGVNREFTGELDSNVTDLNSRRSTAIDAPKPSCPRWLTWHISQLTATGKTAIESAELFAAGQAEGYSRTSLHKAIAAHPGMTVIHRTNTSATWSLIGDQPAYRTAGDWLSSYLDQLDTRTVDPDQVKAAGAVHGYDWDTVRRAAGRSPRIESVPATGNSKADRIWHIITPNDSEAS